MQQQLAAVARQLAPHGARHHGGHHGQRGQAAGVATEQDRSRDERNLADTEFLTREVAALRLALRETATRDFVRSELRDLLDELEERGLRITADPQAPVAKKPRVGKPPKAT